MTPSLTVGRLLERMRDALQLEHVGEPYGLDRPIENAEAHSPGLVLCGYAERFTGQRIQVLGETEVSYLASLPMDQRLRNLERYFAFQFPCLVVTKGQELPEGLGELACRAGVPILRSQLKTNEFYRLIKPFLEDEFAPSTTLHGSLADVFGVGLFFTGKSGIGKSECVLDLVERGHRLVADDLVLTKRRGSGVLIGSGHELQRHHMEIRGVGLIDVPAIFGVRAVRQQKRLEVVVHLEAWEEGKHVDRTGLDGERTVILGVELPKITVPLNPGKNITVVAEVIAMNHLLRYSAGVHTADAFNQRLINRMRQASAESVGEFTEVRRYLQEDDE
ncbi:MAG TPA: HPr(Ser) kinase/phosphatase [Gemmatimonadaceae bacterium]|nr:HPr(Ser) kinase/phosphatase [Gemmatimonadaceae bacterium]